MATTVKANKTRSKQIRKARKAAGKRTMTPVIVVDRTTGKPTVDKFFGRINVFRSFRSGREHVRANYGNSYRYVAVPVVLKIAKVRG